MAKTVLVLLLLIGSNAAAQNSVGMNIHVGWQARIDAAVALGIEWVRVDANWFMLEPSSDNYQWSELDAWVDRSHQAGLHVFMSLAYTPAWVARHGDTDGLFHNDVPDDSAAWVDFVGDAVARMRARGVTHFGIWNEPNLTSFFNGSVQEYVDIILIPGAAAVRNACGDCVVLGPDLAHVDEVDDYLEDVLTLGGTSTFDILSHHMYQSFGIAIWDGDSYDNALDQQRFSFTRRSLRQVLDGVGWSGEVWITETGKKAPTPGGEGAQAEHLTLALDAQLQRSWITNTFFYELVDCKPDQPTCDIDGYGVMRPVSGNPGTRTFPHDYGLKQGFHALQNYISSHPEIIDDNPVPSEDGSPSDPDGGPTGDADGALPGDQDDGASSGDPSSSPGDPSSPEELDVTSDSPLIGAKKEFQERGCSAYPAAGLWLLTSLLFARRRRR